MKRKTKDLTAIVVTKNLPELREFTDYLSFGYGFRTGSFKPIFNAVRLHTGKFAQIDAILTAMSQMTGFDVEKLFRAYLIYSGADDKPTAHGNFSYKIKGKIVIKRKMTSDKFGLFKRNWIIGKVWEFDADFILRGLFK